MTINRKEYNIMPSILSALAKSLLTIVAVLMFAVLFIVILGGQLIMFLLT